MERTRWIVVGMDFSDNADRALNHAIELALETGASIACVHAYEDDPGTAPSRSDPIPRLDSQLAEAVERSGAASRGVVVKPILRRGPPWEKLLNVAADLGADLIVVGANGQRGSVHSFFLGSVATRLAAISTRSVLVVPCGLEVHRRPATPTLGGS
jgi:nucleotide-binding universal stress UspA family protein